MSTTQASPRSTSRAGVRVVLAAALVAVMGCYKPTIEDGGLKCATSGKACPDGYSCGVDQRCRIKPVTVVDAGDGKIMSDGPSDAGGDHMDATMCTLGVVTPTCADSPASGQTCNPACQSGCSCGRCNVVDKATACVAVGTKKLGEICAAGANDDCGAGLICLKEICGNGLARCYKHCTAASQCGGGFCQTAINDDSNTPTKFDVCDLAPQTCDPVANMGCPSGSLNCYLTGGNDTLCDCPRNAASPAKAGDKCAIYNDCDGGLFCIQGSSGAAATCHYTCSLTNPSCPNNAPCRAVGTNTKYGYCDT
ncbi:MAG TPA: hypothetical protein VHJ20_07745 [Polyangia bacterium]|nr:hypothetical protein [Polyangia bacterium]